MKKKKIALLPLLAISLSLYSCDGFPSDPTPSSQAPSSQTDSTSHPQDTTSSPSDVSIGEQILNSGYSIDNSIPDHQGTVQGEEVFEFVRNVYLSWTSGRADPAEVERSIVRNHLVNETATILQAGGITKADLDALEEIVITKYGAQITSFLFEREPNFDELGLLIYDALIDIANLLDRDAFASIVVAWTDFFQYSESVAYSDWGGEMGVILKGDLEFLISLATGDIKTFFQNYLDNSHPLDSVPVSISILNTDGAPWFLGRFAYELAKSIATRIDRETASSMISAVMKLMSGQLPEDAEMVLLVKNVGIILEECFLDKASFKKALEMVYEGIETFKAYDRDQMYFMDNGSTSFALTKQMVETFEFAKNNADSLFTGLKFLGSACKDITAEDYESVMAIFQLFENQGQEETQDYSEAVVRLSEILVRTLTKYGAVKDSVFQGLKDLTRIGFDAYFASYAANYNGMNSHQYEEYTLQIDDSLLDSLLDLIEETSSLEIGNIPDADKEKINSRIESFMKSTEDGLSGTRTVLEFKNNYAVGEKLSLTATTYDLKTNEPVGEPRSIQESDVENFTTKAICRNVAYTMIDGTYFAFLYTIGMDGYGDY